MALSFRKGLFLIKKSTAIVYLCITGYIIYCLITCFDSLKGVVLDSLLLWATVLIPSLFPYLVISEYIFSGACIQLFYPTLGKIFAKLLKISNCSVSAVICGILCGYPSGAICATQLYQKKMISDEEAERIISYTNNAGPLFVISAVGTGMLHNTRDGFALYGIQLFSAFLAGFILGRKAPKGKRCSIHSHMPAKSINECTQRAVSVMINICGFIVLSALIANIIILSLPAQWLFREFPMIEKYIAAAAYSAMEISNGIRRISVFPDSAVRFAFVSSSLSWSGLSVLLQIRSVVPKNIKCKIYFYSKIAQAVFSFGLAYFYKTFFACKELIWDTTETAMLLSLLTGSILFMLYLVPKRHAKRIL